MVNAIDMILLTKSAKYGKYCVAGIDARTGRWVRLVTEDAPSRGALGERDMLCRGAGPAAVLDLVYVPLIGPRPGAHQPENVLIDRSRPWIKLGTATLELVCRLHPPETRKYLLGSKLLFLTEEWLPGYSLTLACVTDLRVYLNDKRKLKCSFTYNTREYKAIAMTDPDFFNIANEVSVGRALLVVSLPDIPYEGKFFKFVAKIFPLDPW